ncbi:unnamed protein product, partial [Schistocephalus solidus]|uniref:RBPJ-interacting and tubulin-associated protein n=1 Tax=Schistocephalus solidus TaxID=70667 RepID=A0A183TP52_SCHSO
CSTQTGTQRKRQRKPSSSSCGHSPASRLASSRLCRHESLPSVSESALRTFPISEVTDQICRLPFPTLLYCQRPVFRKQQDGWCFTKAIPIAPEKPFAGRVNTPYKEKKTPPGTQADVSEVSCVSALSSARLRNRAAFLETTHTLTAQPNACLSPWAGSGILTRFPFAPGSFRLHARAHSHTQTEEDAMHPMSLYRDIGSLKIA